MQRGGRKSCCTSLFLGTIRCGGRNRQEKKQRQKKMFRGEKKPTSDGYKCRSTLKYSESCSHCGKPLPEQVDSVSLCKSRKDAKVAEVLYVAHGYCATAGC